MPPLFKNKLEPLTANKKLKKKSALDAAKDWQEYFGRKLRKEEEIQERKRKRLADKEVVKNRTRKYANN